MAFRVCCSCKSPPGPSEGFVSRLCRVTQTLGTVIGEEDYFWTPATEYANRWKMEFTAPSAGTYLLEGFRVEWYGPTQNGQKFNPNWPISDTSILANLYARISPDYMGEAMCTGGTLKTSSYESAIANAFTSVRSNLLNTKVPLGGHVSNDSLRGIFFGNTAAKKWMREGVTSGTTNNTTVNLPLNTRVKYWRLLVNGSPVSDITPGYHPQSRTSQTMYPIADIGATDWTASTGTDFYALIDEDVALANTSDFIYNSENEVNSITFALSDFEYTGGNNYVRLKMKAAWVDASGALIVTSSGFKAELLYEGNVIGLTGTSFSSSASVWRDINLVLQSTTDVSVPYTESCNYIPKDAEPDRFRVRITPNHPTNTKRLAIAALNVTCEPFSYFLDNVSLNEPQTYWPIETGYRIPWRKNARLGFDLWLEREAEAAEDVEMEIGQSGASTSIGKYEGLDSETAHGVLGIRTTFMPEYDVSRATYKIRWANGERFKLGHWNLFQDAGGPQNTLTFRQSDYQRSNLFTGFRRACGSADNGGTLTMQLIWNREIPEIWIDAGGFAFEINGVSRARLRYIPEDTGHAIDNFYFNHSTTLGNIYVNVQTPGGVWKQKSITKFLLEAPTQVSQTNSFTPEPLQDMDDFPTEIEVSIAYPPQTYTYTEDDKWTCPDHITSITVECFGGGGGGGGVNEDADTSGGGGGGGGYSKYTNLTVTPGETYDITVGAGGTAGAIGGGNGGNGSATDFSYSGSTLCKAFGGTGGQGESGGGFGTGGTGASTGSAIGTTKFAGGNGAAGDSAGGGGGTSGASSGNGTAATTSTGATKTGAGSGGNGKTSTTPGSAGSPPGGGGGGGFAVAGVGSAGYAGGDGRLTLTY
jgi:hypothetical protein